jgi:ABC-type lipoprotein release transport system permease subunit
LAAILFGQSLSKTIQYQLVEKATSVFTGHLRIQSEDVTDLKFPDAYMDDPMEIESLLEGMSNVKGHQRRIFVTGLASSKTESAAILIIGVEPDKDKRLMTMSSYLKEGVYLDAAGPDGVYLGDKLAAQLKLGLHDEIVLMASCADGSMGAELGRIAGIYHTDSHTFDKTIAYVGLETAQRLLDIGEGVNNIVFMLDNPDKLDETAAALRRVTAGRPLKVVSWEDVDAELVGIREYQDAVLNIVLLVVFFIVALGILNTLLMAMFERVREFGVLMALGARPSVIRKMIVMESFVMGVLGTVIGLGLGGGLILYYHYTGLELPIGDSVGFFMPFESVLYLRFQWQLHGAAVAAVLATSVLSGLPPAFRASRLNPADSLRHI